MRAAVVVYPGFDELDAIGPYEVLRTAQAAGADLEAVLVSRDSAAAVTGAHGLTVEPQGTLDDARFDIVIVPGGGWNNRAPQGAHAEARRGELPAALRELHGRIRVYGGDAPGSRRAHARAPLDHTPSGPR
jgi:putative intracellular protease/amidase